MTLQKGLRHLLDAVPYLAPDAQVVLCAGAADTLTWRGVRGGSGAFATATDRGDLIPTMVPRQTTIAPYSHAAVFCCPSIYEPSDSSIWKPWPVKRRWWRVPWVAFPKSWCPARLAI